MCTLSAFVCYLLIKCICSECEGQAEIGCVYMWLTVYLNRQTPDQQYLYLAMDVGDYITSFCTTYFVFSYVYRVTEHTASEIVFTI